MLKHLITPFLALTLSLSAHAQLHMGLAFDYQHMPAPSIQNIGNGSEYGGSVFFRVPFSSHLNLEWSVDLGGGKSRTYYWTPTQQPPYPDAHIIPRDQSLVYVGIPVHLTYSHSFRDLRVFAGPGIAWTTIAITGPALMGSNNNNSDCSSIAASFKAGCELYRHIVLSGEFRPWRAYLKNNESRFSNNLSVKLGYEIPLKKRSAQAHS